MTYPREFRNDTKSLSSSSGIKHPIYRFSVNLNRMTEEKIGPNTNQSTVNLLHPSMHTNSPDSSREQMTAHNSVDKHTWLPSVLQGPNIDVNHDGTITAAGSQAVYLKKTYADVENPLLTLVNSAPYTSAD